MTALLVKTSAWNGDRLPMDAPVASEGSKTHHGWMKKLHLTHHDNKEQKPHQHHRFSLSRLFHDHHSHPQEESHHYEDNQRAELCVEPLKTVKTLEIPPLLLMNERNGGVTVSGKRVPFTRDAHRRKKRKAVRPLPKIGEDRALGQSSSAASIDAYRRRAYYGKHKEKK